jgi:hypothetical protein
VDLLTTKDSRRKLGPYARSLFFDKHTVETLCNAAVEAEDAVTYADAAGKTTSRTASFLTEAEQEMFSTVRIQMGS